MTKMTKYRLEHFENKVNRSVTFKIAFMQNWKALSNNNSLIYKAIEKNKNRFEWKDKNGNELSVSKVVEKEIIRKSSRFAAEAVKLLHYDYASFAKPMALRNPLGSVLGQFSTYSINFFEYQRKIFSEGGKDLIHGDWNTDAAWRAYRMGSFYTLINAMIAPLFSMDIGNLIQNDTMDRIESAYWLFASDPEDHLKYKDVVSDHTLLIMQAAEELRNEQLGSHKPKYITTQQWKNNNSKQLKKIIEKIEKDNKRSAEKYTRKLESQYGLKFWGPTPDAFMDVANWISNLSLSTSELEELSTGYSHIEELTAILNPQIRRTAFSSFPALVNGSSLWNVAGQELGLYKNYDMPFRIGGSNERRENIYSGIRKIAPSSLDPYFTPEKDVDKRFKKDKYKLGNVNFSEAELKDVLNSLKSLEET